MWHTDALDERYWEVMEAVRAKAWYLRYSEHKAAVEEKQRAFAQRARELGKDERALVTDVTRELLIRAVHESNWQEGVRLDEGTTQRMAGEAFDALPEVLGPHLDMDAYVEEHRKRILTLDRNGASTEMIAAFNLTTAHAVLRHIQSDLFLRRAAHNGTNLRSLTDASLNGLEQSARETVEAGLEAISFLAAAKHKLEYPLTHDDATFGDVFQSLMDLPPGELLPAMRESYLHFLHRLAMMGILPTRELGRYRDESVTVGDPDVVFPPHTVVPQLASEFCRAFPADATAGRGEADRIMAAAEASYRFVAIHPYADGNGRVSRLIMNLVLGSNHLPVAIKSDKKGRHRYSQALKRANRGNMEPLACHIAMSLCDTYDIAIKAVTT